MTVHTVSESALGELRKLGKPGGQGTVFRTQFKVTTTSGTHNALYKRYHFRDEISTPDLAGLARQIELLTSLSPSEGRWLTERVAWPMMLVGRTGFLMAEAPSQFRVNLAGDHGMEAHLASTQFLLNPDPYLRRHQLVVTDEWRLDFLADVAETLAWLHGRGVTIGDFSCNNILFARSGSPKCFLIDSDSSLLGMTGALPPADTPEWDCPGEQTGSEPVDVYKFGLLVVRLFTGSQMAREVPRGRLPADLERLAAASLSSGGTRPKMDEWQVALRRAVPRAPEQVRQVPTPQTSVAKVAPVTPVALSASPRTAVVPQTRKKRKGARKGALVVGLIAAAPIVANVIGHLDRPFSPATSPSAYERTFEPSAAPTPTDYGPFPTLNDLRLWIRSEPSTSAEIVGEIASRSSILIECQVEGESVKGPEGKSNYWNRVAAPAAGYVSDAWVGTSSEAIPTCE